MATMQMQTVIWSTLTYNSARGTRNLETTATKNCKKRTDRNQWELDFESFVRMTLDKLNDGATLESLKAKLRSYSYTKRTNISADHASCFY